MFYHSGSFHTDYVTALACGGLGRREGIWVREWCCSGYTATMWHTYGHTQNIHPNMKHNPVALINMCLFIIWFTSPVAFQHNCSLYHAFLRFSANHLSQAQTNHTYIFTNYMQHFPATVNHTTGLRNLFHFTKFWQLVPFLSVSHTYSQPYTCIEAHTITTFSPSVDPVLGQIQQAGSLSPLQSLHCWSIHPTVNKASQQRSPSLTCLSLQHRPMQRADTGMSTHACSC